MKVQLVNPDPGVEGSAERHARIVPVLASVGLDPLVLAGAVIDVPDHIGGAGEHWRAPRDDEFEGDIGLQHLLYLRDTSGLRYADDGSIRSVRDLGHGLLAQPDLWSRADKPSATPSNTPNGGE